MAQEFYTPKEAGALLKLSERTVRRLIAQGDLRAVNLGASTKVGRMRISEEELERFIDERTQAVS